MTRLDAIAVDLRTRRAGAGEIAAEVQRIAAESARQSAPIAEIELHLQAARDPALQEASRRCFAAYEGVAVAALGALGIAEPERHGGAVVALIAGMSLKGLGTGTDRAPELVDGLKTIVRGMRRREG